jgi:hypothetical protein
LQRTLARISLRRRSNDIAETDTAAHKAAPANACLLTAALGLRTGRRGEQDLDQDLAGV